MSSGKLKAQYNRVRTSTALQANSMWTSTIGLDQEAGTNSAVEASLRAPTRGGGGGGREARRQAAQDLIEASGYQPAVTSFEGLVALAREKNIGGENRGACKICGGLGHLTKQCRNQPATTVAKASAEAGGVPIMQLIPPDTAQESDSSLSDLSSSSGSDSDSSSERRKKRKRKHKSGEKEKKSHKSKAKKSKKSSKEKRSKEKRSKEKRHKSSRQD